MIKVIVNGAKGKMGKAAVQAIENDSYLEESVRSILQKMKNRKFIFNVGHGLTPECKITNVKNVINIVRNYNRDY